MGNVELIEPNYEAIAKAFTAAAELYKASDNSPLIEKVVASVLAPFHKAPVLKLSGEIESEITPDDVDHLKWCYSRLARMELKGADYMIRFQEIIEKLEK